MVAAMASALPPIIVCDEPETLKAMLATSSAQRQVAQRLIVEGLMRILIIYASGGPRAESAKPDCGCQHDSGHDACLDL